jgi:D-serine dehydratase
MEYSTQKLQELKQQNPLLEKIINLEPVIWLNPNLKSAQDLEDTNLDINDIEEAEKLWKRFAPFIAKSFPETSRAGGIIESALVEIPEMKTKLEETAAAGIKGDIYLKCDNELPVAGSIKARGGFYEVLHYAESLALKANMISKTDNYELFSSTSFQDFFKQYSIGVGSTGNLGLSIGIMSAKLGFQVSVYMSADAKQWKKDLLRKKGVTVHEYEGDFSQAIDIGRQETLAKPGGYFIDDEDSDLLFLGYSTAALRLQKQLAEKNIQVNEDHPLVVYLPCGVGGAPGGITFGLKQVFGDHVHCFFVEPTHSPSALIGLLTGLRNEISVQDVGIDNHTAADGLAVGRPSRFATVVSDQLVSGIYTIEDDILFKLLAELWDSEGIFIEPSAAAGLMGPGKILQTNELKLNNIDGATHIVWATGGALVPETDRQQFYERGLEIKKA